jgi:hypothetical protein
MLLFDKNKINVKNKGIAYFSIEIGRTVLNETNLPRLGNIREYFCFHISHLLENHFNLFCSRTQKKSTITDHFFVIFETNLNL